MQSSLPDDRDTLRNYKSGSELEEVAQMEDEEEERGEEEDDEEPRLKYTRLTKSLGGVYRNGDAVSTSVVFGDRMVRIYFHCNPCAEKGGGRGRSLD